ncbi:hypothetical protein J3F84DRAFT_357348, partial [Trichoderma pleuroticola]
MREADSLLASLYDAQIHGHGRFGFFFLFCFGVAFGQKGLKWEEKKEESFKSHLSIDFMLGVFFFFGLGGNGNPCLEQFPYHVSYIHKSLGFPIVGNLFFGFPISLLSLGFFAGFDALPRSSKI